MATCLNFEDILEIGHPQLDLLQKVGDSFPTAEAPGAGEAFARQVRVLEGVLTQTYAVGVAIARRADDLHEVAHVWEQMGLFCMAAVQRLAQLRHKYPSCGTSQLFDLSLNYKLACEKRCRSALEEIECQRQEIPTGLFPAQI